MEDSLRTKNRQSVENLLNDELENQIDFLSQKYDSVSQQDITITRLQIAVEKAPPSDKFYFCHSDKIAGIVSLCTGLVCWRSGFKGFNLARYDKSRIPSLLVTCTTSVNGWLIHNMVVSDNLCNYFRKENMYYYGLLSVVANNLSLAICIPTAFTFTFLNAQRLGLVMVPDKFLSKENRPVTIKEFTSRLRPYKKTIFIAYAISNLVSLYIGCRAYSDSVNLLGKMNRKTLSYREINN